MSIASEITRISGNVADAYTAANAKGATMPVTQNSDNLATTISTIQTGTTPTGTKSITANGVYDVTDFASADVQVPTTAPAHYVEKTVDANGKLINGATNAINLNGVTDIGDKMLYFAYYGGAVVGNVDFSSLINISGQYACYEAFYLCQGITSVNLSSLTTVSGFDSCNQMFLWCTGITSIDLSSLTTVSGSNGCRSMFGSCASLTSVDLSSLTTISGSSGCQQMFSGCTSLTSVDLSSLTTISGSSGCSMMFSGTGLTSVELSSLTTLSGSAGCQQMFLGCTQLTTLSFPALTSTSFGSYTNQFNYMLSGVTGCTVHFPSNLQSVIGSWSDVTAGFSGINTTVLFDLPATN